MKNKPALFCLCLLPVPGLLHAQGPLTPPGPPGPTMKTLDQIEARTPIASAPYTISQPGSYYLTGNLTVSSGNAITIAAHGVTLDLNGFTISSTAPAAAGYGVFLNGGLQDLSLSNGHIRSGVTYNTGTGLYSGSGFAGGISYSEPPPANVLVSKISVSGCQFYGINLSTGEANVVDSCTVRTAGSSGISAARVRNSSAIQCGLYGIVGWQISDSRGETTGGDGILALGSADNCQGLSGANGDGVEADVANGCRGTSTGSGAGVRANSTAANCRGTSAGGDGITANIATNCQGVATGGGAGVRAAATATSCLGTSASGDGISADAATACRGTSGGTGSGVRAVGTATSCSGESTAGSGIDADSATGCRGRSNGNNPGVSAATAENCYGSSAQGDGFSVITATGCQGWADQGGKGVWARGTAVNCLGTSTTGNCVVADTATGCRGVSFTVDSPNHGIVATVATNCMGYVRGSGNAVYATSSATNCDGYSETGDGIYTETATGCRGRSTSGRGIFANYQAMNCTGISSSGRGLFTALATNCFGQTATGDWAIYAQVANTCRGWQTDNAGIAVIAEIAIGCTSAGGTISAPSKQLGTP